jgi:cytochrome c
MSRQQSTVGRRHHAGARTLIVLFAALLIAAVPMLPAPSLAENLEGHGGPVKAIALSSDGAAALTGSFDYSMIRWRLDGDKAEIVHRFEDHDAAVNAVEFVPGTDWAVAAGDDGSVKIWNLKTSELVHQFAGHGHKVVDVAVSADGTMVASAGWDRTVRLWDLQTLEPAGVLEGHRDRVNTLAFSSDASVLYSGGIDGTVMQWNVPQAVLLRRIVNYGWGVNVLRLLPNETRLLFGAIDGTVNVLDIAAGKVERTLITHEGPVLSTVVSEKYGIAASGGGDGKIHVWAINGWRLQRSHDNPYGPVWAMAVTADGRSFYYGSLDDFAIHWNMIPGHPFEEVSSRYPRRFQVDQDVGLGERQFARKCSICHTLTPDGANRAGPTLYDVFGRRAGTLPGYIYSEALKNSDIIWDEDTIGRLFGDGPQEVVPGTKMPLQKMTNAEERNALIAFLKQATTP